MIVILHGTKGVYLMDNNDWWITDDQVYTDDEQIYNSVDLEYEKELDDEN